MPSGTQHPTPPPPPQTQSPTAYLDGIIAAQWRMTPLDIMAEPTAAIAPMTAPEGGQDGRDAAAAMAVYARASRRLQESQSRTLPIRLWWRRKLVEPLINDTDRAADVWRKGVFCALYVLVFAGIVALAIAGALSMKLAPTESNEAFQEHAFLILVGCVGLAYSSTYAIVRYTKTLSDWGYYATYAQMACLVHLFCVLNGPTHASTALVVNPVFLVMWLCAVETTQVKLAGVATSLVLSVVAVLQTLRMLDVPTRASGAALTASHSFRPVAVAFVATQCVLSMSAFGLMLFERHAAQAATSASRAVQAITRALLVDEYSTVMKLLTDFRTTGGADAIGGTTGAMLSMRFEAVADSMRIIRPYIPDHVFAVRPSRAQNPGPALPPVTVSPSVLRTRNRSNRGAGKPPLHAMERRRSHPAYEAAGVVTTRAAQSDAMLVDALADESSDGVVTVLLLQYRGKAMTSNVSVLDAALRSVKAADGVVEFVGFNYLLASFFGDSPQQAEATLQVAMELRALFAHRPGSSVSVHQGPGWVGVCRTATRRWRFVGGAVVEALWRMPSVAQQSGARCIATECVVALRPEACCPIDMVAIDPEQRDSLAEVIYEVHGDNLQTPTVKSPLSACRLPSNALCAETEVSVALPDGVYANRAVMLRVVMLLSKGALRHAAECLQLGISNPSPHILRLRRAIESAHRRGRAVYFKQWLGWGAVKTPVAVNRLAASGTAAMAECSSSLEHSQTSLGQMSIASQALAQSGSVSVYDRVRSNISEWRRKIETTAKEEALFEMFVTPDSGEEIPSYITDSAQRCWRRSRRAYGRGAYGWVFGATGEFGDIVAVKCMDLESRVISATAEEVSREIHTLSELRHENIVGYIDDGLHGHHYFVIMELVPGGSLADLLLKFKALPVAAVARYVRDALAGLKYLHENHVMHCDIKPANILITASGRCKLSDFGSAVNLSCVKPEATHQDSVLPGSLRMGGPTGASQLGPSEASLAWSQSSQSFLRSCAPHAGHGDSFAPGAPPTPDAGDGDMQRPPNIAMSTESVGAADNDDLVARGTAHYMAPEACRNEGVMASDVWSLGITACELLLGHVPWKSPFCAQQEAMFIRQLGKHADPLSEIEWGHLARLGAATPGGVDAEAFVRVCLAVDATQRPSVDTLLVHPFLCMAAGVV